MNKKAILNQLVAMQHTLESIIHLLMEEDGQPVCQHQNRNDLRSFGDTKDQWVCLDCGYQYEEQEKEGDA